MKQQRYLEVTLCYIQSKALCQSQQFCFLNFMNKWEVSLAEFRDNGNRKYKLTRRIPGLSVSETKFFETKEEAITKMKEWLDSGDPFP